MKKRKPAKQPKQPLTSSLIVGALPTAETARKMRAQMGLQDDDAQINPMVLEVQIGGRNRYCCWSGGEVPRAPDGGPPDWTQTKLTLAGQAAMEALTALPFLTRKALVFQEVKLGPTPLQQKVVEAFERTADVDAAIVFVGDLAGELDGKMTPAFNLCGMVDLDAILARGKPAH